jgi:hypothetical protein
MNNTQSSRNSSPKISPLVREVSNSPTDFFHERNSAVPTKEKVTSQLSFFERPKPIISFSNQLRVILIPCRQEYHACGIHQELWWQAPDYLQFKNDAVNEVSMAMSRNRLSVKNTIDHLFQGHGSTA